MCTNRCKEYSTYIVGAVVVIIGVVVLIIWPGIYTSIIKDELVLKNNSRSFDMWVETPIPMYLEMYMFNWTNMDAFLKDKTIKPHFEECGPYVFSETHFKTNITWNSGNETITFKQKRKWIFIENKSKGSLSDVIQNINVITATVGYSLREKAGLIKHAVDILLREEKEKLVISKTVKELLFDGYEDRFINLVRRLNVTNFNIPYDKFGWFYPRNESIDYDGIFNMETGANSVSHTGDLNWWNYQTKTNFYNNECGMINGTTGELWPPIGKSEKISMFISDFCRTLDLEYDSKLDKHGLVGRKYIGTDRIFDNGTKYPETACFSHKDVLPSGVLNVSLCRFGAPAFVSYPHFYLADPSYAAKISGMMPDPEKHKFFIALEPTTGIPLQVHAALQLNIMIQNYKGISLFEGLERTFIPMLWFRQTAELTQELANEAKVVVLITTVVEYTSFGVIGIGSLILCIALYLTLTGRWTNKHKHLIPVDQSDSDVQSSNSQNNG